MKKKELSKVKRVIYFLIGTITLFIGIKIAFFLPEQAYRGGGGTPSAQLGMLLARHPIGKVIIFGLFFLVIYSLFLYPAYSGKTLTKKMERPDQNSNQKQKREYSDNRDNREVNYEEAETKYDKLEKINELKEKNILSEEEFQEEKEKILES
mgnify:CR=1 FL=1